MIKNIVSKRSNQPVSPIWVVVLFVLLLILLWITGVVVVGLSVNKLLMHLSMLLLTAVLIYKPALGLAGFGLLYLNVPGILSQYHGLSPLFAAMVTALLLIPFLSELYKKRKIVIDYPLLLMILFIAILLAASLGARDSHLAIQYIVEYITEGILIYFLVINIVRERKTLQKVLFILFASAVFLSTLSLYQEFSHRYDQQFAGFAQRNLEHEQNSAANNDLFRTAQRAAGPIGDPNRYAQILLFLLPPALFFVRHGKSGSKYMAMLTMIVLPAVILLTYSRGALIALLLAAIMLWQLKQISGKKVILGIVILLLMLSVLAPSFYTRLDAVNKITGLFSQKREEEPEAVIRGRLTEMLAAVLVFLDHPILGVGPGQYTPYYSVEYMNNPQIAFRQLDEPRRAHNMYFELAAETGIVGITLFMIIVGLLINNLNRAAAMFSSSNQKYADLAGLLTVAIYTYLVTALFLHLSYQRYYWLFLGLAGAVVHILRTEQNQSDNNSVRSDA
jgi:O-antigen ligase